MKIEDPRVQLPTHDVTNQASPFIDVNLYESDPALVDAIEREASPWLTERCARLGERAGSAEMQAWGHLANANPPVFKPFDRYGHRTDVVEFHPHYHDLMRTAMDFEIHSCAWKEERSGHVGMAAMEYLFGQAEAGVVCPITMTYAAVPSLEIQPEVADEYLPKLVDGSYDPSFQHVANKRGATFGMAMTEKQGGSDVRANSTRAAAIGAGGPGGEYLLTGHKWFCSAPMSDAFLTLANAPGGLSCFLVPRFRPDDSQNPLYIQRLKDKLGNKSNASSEIEYNNTWARLIGEEGAGVRTIIEMVRHTRLCCVAGSSALIRQSFAQALNHTQGRAAFGKLLIDQPLMRNVLADLALESEASMQIMFRVARAFDRQKEDESEAAFARLCVTIAKYWVCKRTPRAVYEAMECHGGAGYVEESPLPRLLREAPLNSIWEGSGNVMCLDVLRAMQREPECVEAVMNELLKTRGAHDLYDAALGRIRAELSDTDHVQLRARSLTELLAVTMQSSLMLQHAPAPVATAFVESRLGAHRGHEYGTLPAGAALDLIISRASNR